MLENRWLILGGTGFIGTNLCRRLVQNGADVVALGRSVLMPTELAGCRWLSGHFYDNEALSAAIDKVDYVVHAVSTVTPAKSNESPIADVEGNLIGTLRLLEMCQKKPVKRFIFLSSGGTIYGPDVAIPTPEDAPNDPICSYGIVKLAIEKYLMLFRRQGLLDSVVLRVANPYGPYQRGKEQGVIAAAIQRILANQSVEVWGDGTVIRDYIYIDDVVDAIISAANLDFNSPCIYNIGSGVGRSVNNIIESIAKIHNPLNIKRIPGRSVDVPINILDIRRAESFLGWHPKSEWMESLRSTYLWFNQQHQLRSSEEN